MRPYKQKLAILIALTALSATNVYAAEEVAIAPTSIATGSPQWVASNGDQSSVDALVDIGSMRQIGDALEVFIRWPYLPASYGPEPAEKDHIFCQVDRALSFSVEEGFFSPDGKYLIKEAFNPENQREQAKQLASQMAKTGNGFWSYGSDPRSLACWAAARKCAGQDFTWPPPPNRTPLEYTEKARKMNDAYKKMFVPTCKIE